MGYKITGIEDTTSLLPPRAMTAFDDRYGPIRVGAAEMGSGKWYAGHGGTVATILNPEGRLAGSRLVAARAATINSLAVEVTTAGSAGALIRLALLLLDPSNGNGTLLADGGSVDGTTVGIKTVTITASVKTGAMLLPVAICQGSAATRATLRANVGSDPYIGNTSNTALSSGTFGGLQFDGVSGAVPAAVSLSPAAYGSLPRVMIKVT